ncbi:hypothetical protein BD560DRAFT_403175 [Blakeslea trispora]|nr:hypothetical protein BD560DRAFT_403175 [Blakeslea trispora]
MISKFFYFFIVASLFTITQAFNLKSILFGDDGEGTQERHASVPFGTPMTKRSASKRYDANIVCEHYVCEDTYACVKEPIDCPCLASTDKKCYIGDWYACVRGNEDCAQLL